MLKCQHKQSAWWPKRSLPETQTFQTYKQAGHRSKVLVQQPLCVLSIVSLWAMGQTMCKSKQSAGVLPTSTYSPEAGITTHCTISILFSLPSSSLLESIKHCQIKKKKIQFPGLSLSCHLIDIMHRFSCCEHCISVTCWRTMVKWWPNVWIKVPTTQQKDLCIQDSASFFPAFCTQDIVQVIFICATERIQKRTHITFLKFPTSAQLSSWTAQQQPASRYFQHSCLANLARIG